MTSSFGAGFLALSVLVALAVLAVLLALLGVAAVALRRRIGRVPALLRYLAVAALTVGVGVAGFGVLALLDEAPVAAGLVLATVFAPLGVAGLRLHRTTDLRPLEVLAATAMAWGLPFVVGAVLFFALDLGVAAALDLAPAESGRLWVSWAAVAGSGLAAVGGTAVLAGRVAGWLRPGATS